MIGEISNQNSTGSLVIGGKVKNMENLDTH